jgi:hypothetical protein
MMIASAAAVLQIHHGFATGVNDIVANGHATTADSDGQIGELIKPKPNCSTLTALADQMTAKTGTAITR